MPNKSITQAMIDTALEDVAEQALEYGTCRYCQATEYPVDAAGARLDPFAPGDAANEYHCDHTDLCPVTILGRVPDLQLPAGAVPFGRLPEGARFKRMGYLDKVLIKEGDGGGCYYRFEGEKPGYWTESADPWLLVLPLEEPTP